LNNETAEKLGAGKSTVMARNEEREDGTREQRTDDQRKK
jgi:hypothetical protein